MYIWYSLKLYSPFVSPWFLFGIKNVKFTFWGCSPLHTLFHHSKVSISDHFADLVLLIDDGGGNWPITVYCEGKNEHVSGFSLGIDFYVQLILHKLDLYMSNRVLKFESFH